MDILVTRRLTLRPPLEVDAEAIAAHLNNTNVSRMLSNVPQPYSEDDAIEWINKTAEKKGSFYFSMYRRTLAGVISVEKRETGYNLGYWLGEDHWGKGYMSEAARAVLSYAFRSLDTDVIISGAYEDNPASLRILEKLGFESTKTIQDFNATRQCDVACNKVALTRTRFEMLFGKVEAEAAA